MVQIQMCSERIGMSGTKHSSNHWRDFMRIVEACESMSYAIRRSVQRKQRVDIRLLHLGQSLGVWSPSGFMRLVQPTAWISVSS